MIEQAKSFMNAFFPALGFMAILYGGIWIKRIFDQKRKNQIDEIKFVGKEISLKNHSDPIDNLVAKSNQSHGANDVVSGSRDDSK